MGGCEGRRGDTPYGFTLCVWGWHCPAAFELFGGATQHKEHIPVSRRTSRKPVWGVQGPKILGKPLCELLMCGPGAAALVWGCQEPLTAALVQGEDPCAWLSSSSSCRKPTFGSAERKTPVKKLVSEFSKVKSKTPKHSPGKEESGGSLAETVCKRELRSQETPEKPRSLLETPLRASAPPKGPGPHPKEKGFVSEADDLPYLSTTEMYLCRWHQPPPSPLPLREPSPKKEETVASKDGENGGEAAGAEPAWKQGSASSF